MVVHSNKSMHIPHLGSYNGRHLGNMWHIDKKQRQWYDGIAADGNG